MIRLHSEWARVPQHDVLSAASSFTLGGVARGPHGFIEIGDAFSAAEQRDVFESYQDPCTG